MTSPRKPLPFSSPAICELAPFVQSSIIPSPPLLAAQDATAFTFHPSKVTEVSLSPAARSAAASLFLPAAVAGCHAATPRIQPPPPLTAAAPKAVTLTSGHKSLRRSYLLLMHQNLTFRPHFTLSGIFVCLSQSYISSMFELGASLRGCSARQSCRGPFSSPGDAETAKLELTVHQNLICRPYFILPGTYSIQLPNLLLFLTPCSSQHIHECAQIGTEKSAC